MDSMNTSGGYFMSQYDPTTGSGSGGGGAHSTTTTDRKNIVSVSLSQVIHWTRKDDGLVIHRQKVHSITCIGLVLSVEELTTKNIYTIDDQSRGAPIEVQYWKNDDSESTNSRYVSPPIVLENQYIRVIGQPRYDDKKPFIVAFRVETISDPNEIYMHFLEVISDSLILQRRKIETLSNSVNSGFVNKSFANSSASHDMSGTRLMQGFTEIQKTVLNLINQKSSQSSAGIHRNEITSSIPGVNPKDIGKAIDFLSNEGHIFSTIDEDTFRSTDA